MSDADVAAVLAQALFRSGGVMDWLVGSMEGRKADPDKEIVKVVLAALSAAGIRCLYVPEGVEVEHGARLGRITQVNSFTGERFYSIEPPRQPKLASRWNPE